MKSGKKEGDSPPKTATPLRARRAKKAETKRDSVAKTAVESSVAVPLLDQTDSSSQPEPPAPKNHYLTKTVKFRMAAHSGKQFQDLLCEGRAHSVETTDPVAAKVIDELKKQVAKQKAEIDVDKVNLREVQRNHEKEVRSIRDQAEKKLEKSLEALSRHKDDEKVTEVSQVKERLLKQNQHELRTQRAELEDEMRRLERRLTREREESMRKILDFERKKTEQELSHYLPEDSVMTREEHLKAEIFRLGEEVERVEFQVRDPLCVCLLVSLSVCLSVCCFVCLSCMCMYKSCMTCMSLVYCCLCCSACIGMCCTCIYVVHPEICIIIHEYPY